MQYLFNCCSNHEDNDYMTQDVLTETKICGKDRILRLNQQEYFQEYTKYFQNDEVKNIFENDSSSNDVFNLNKENNIFNIKNSNQCIFCGGKSCKYEDPSLYNNSAIKGLISDIFYDCIYASQRPSTILIEKYDLINTFKKNNIKLIVNCEIHGEHPNCGPNKGLELDSGYSYSPSLFISEDIDVFVCGFEEMSVPFTFDFMLDIVKKIAYVIKYKNGKVLVHCHSGNDRACLVIVCFLIFYFNKTADQAINEVRTKRKNAINNESQEEYCHKFEIYMTILKSTFSKKQMPIENYIKYQNDMDYNLDNNANIPSIIPLFFKENNCGKDINYNNKIYSKVIYTKYIPKLLVICLDKIIQIKNKYGLKNDNLYQILNGMNKISDQEIKELQLIKKEINKNDWSLLNQNENLLIITELLFSWINENVIECINPKKIDRLWNKCNILFNDKKNYQNNQNTNHSEEKYVFEEFMKGNSPMTKNNINKFISLFKIIFSKTECEIIKYISIFLAIIYPILNSEDKTITKDIKEYSRFVYKLCLFLLGYNLDKVNVFSDKKNLKEMNDVKRFILILEFFIFYSCNKDKKELLSNNNIINSDWINNYLELKKKNEEIGIKDSDDIMTFFNEKPNIDLISIKYIFIFNIDKNKNKKLE